MSRLMKIGIITYHRAKNYGAMLQAYALQEKLRTKYDATIVDYRNPFIEKSYYVYKQGLVKIVKMIVKCFLRRKQMMEIVRKDYRFAIFQKRWFILGKKYTPKNVILANKYYDVFISGSDQIWNVKWSEHDWNYFLAFADNKKKYSYAASISNTIAPGDRDRIKRALDSYNTVIVREQQSIGMLRKIGVNNDIIAACDPVFFWGREEWIERFNLKKRDGKYILLYIIEKDTYSIEFARAIALSESTYHPMILLI